MSPANPMISPREVFSSALPEQRRATITSSGSCWSSANRLGKHVCIMHKPCKCAHAYCTCTCGHYMLTSMRHLSIYPCTAHANAHANAHAHAHAHAHMHMHAHAYIIFHLERRGVLCELGGCGRGLDVRRRHGNCGRKLGNRRGLSGRGSDHRSLDDCGVGLGCHYGRGGRGAGELGAERRRC